METPLLVTLSTCAIAFWGTLFLWVAGTMGGDE